MRKIGFLIAVLGMACSAVFAADNGQVVPPVAAPAVAPAAVTLKYIPKCKLAVLDFMILDIAAEKYLKFVEKKDTSPAQQTLNSADRKSVNDVMQGVVRSIDAYDEHRANENRRDRMNQVNDREWAKRDHWRSLLTMTAQGRSTVAGAELLAACLGEHSDLFEIVDRKSLEDTLREVEAAKAGAVDANSVTLIKKMTGATHFVYGVVMDMAREEQKFQGYGIKTNGIVYRLDVMVKVVDITTMTVLFSRNFTGSMTEMRTEFASYHDSAIFNDLMKNALMQADAAIYEFFKSRVPMSPSVSFSVTINPRGDSQQFDPRDAEIFIDGVFKGSAPATLPLAPGRHVVEIKMNGYETKKYDMEFKGGENLSPKLNRLNNAPAF